MSEPTSRINVSEDKLKLLFAEFKIELIKEMNSFARAADVEKWKERVDERFRKIEEIQAGSTAVSRSQRWLLGLAVSFASAVVGALIFLVSTGGGH